MNSKAKTTISAFDDSSFRQDFINIFLIASAYFLAHGTAFIFRDSEKAIMLVWLAGGIGLAAFLLNKRRLWLTLTAAFYISGISLVTILK